MTSGFIAEGHFDIENCKEYLKVFKEYGMEVIHVNVDCKREENMTRLVSDENSGSSIRSKGQID
jgi:hypothetical protein